MAALSSGWVKRRVRGGSIVLLCLFICASLATTYLRSAHHAQVSFGDRNAYPSKVLVMATTKGADVSWLWEIESDWDLRLYVTDDPTADLTVPVDKGHEAMVYLTYIIDYYSELPDVSFFHHNHAAAWHQANDIRFELDNLQSSYVLEKGYVSTRCLAQCENELDVANTTVPLVELRNVDKSYQLASIFQAFLGGDVPIPGSIAAPCCAQFAVSREAILRKPLSYWKGIRQWLIDTPLDSATSGRLLEWTWHVWFGAEAR